MAAIIPNAAQEARKALEETIKKLGSIVVRSSTAPLSNEDVAFLARHRSLLPTPPFLPYVASLALAMTAVVQQAVVRHLAAQPPAHVNAWVPNVPRAFNATQVLRTLFSSVSDAALDSLRPSTNAMALTISKHLCETLHVPVTPGRAHRPNLPLNAQAVVGSYLGVTWLLLGATVAAGSIADVLRHMRDVALPTAAESLDRFIWFLSGFAEALNCLLETSAIDNRVELACELVLDHVAKTSLRIPRLGLSHAVSACSAIQTFVFRVIRLTDLDAQALATARRFETALAAAAVKRLEAAVPDHRSHEITIMYVLAGCAQSFANVGAPVLARLTLHYLLVPDATLQAVPFAAMPSHHVSTLVLFALERGASFSAIQGQNSFRIPPEQQREAVRNVIKQYFSAESQGALIRHFFSGVLNAHVFKADAAASFAIAQPNPSLAPLSRMVAIALGTATKPAELLSIFAGELEIVGREVNTAFLAVAPSGSAANATAKALGQYAFAVSALLLDPLTAFAEKCNPALPSVAASGVRHVVPIYAGGLAHSQTLVSSDQQRQRHTVYQARVKMLVTSVAAGVAASTQAVQALLDDVRAHAENLGRGTFVALKATLYLWALGLVHAPAAPDAAPRAPKIAKVAPPAAVMKDWMPAALHAAASTSPLAALAAHEAIVALIIEGNPLALHVAATYTNAYAPTPPGHQPKYGVVTTTTLSAVSVFTGRVCRAVEVVSKPSAAIAPSKNDQQHSITGPDVARALVIALADNARHWSTTAMSSNQRDHNARKQYYITGLINTLQSSHEAVLSESCGQIERVLTGVIVNPNEQNFWLTAIEQLLGRSENHATKTALVEWLVLLREKVETRAAGATATLRRSKL